MRRNTRLDQTWVLPCILILLTVNACSVLERKSEIVGKVGWSPPLIPIRIGLNTAGRLSVTFSGAVATPIGVFDVGVSGSTPIVEKINALRNSGELPAKRLLIVRVDGEATIYELDRDSRFDVSAKLICTHSAEL